MARSSGSRGRGFSITEFRKKKTTISGLWAHHDIMILLKIKTRPFAIQILQTDKCDKHLEEYYEDMQRILNVVK